MKSIISSSTPTKSTQGIELVRVAVALIIIAHPIHGVMHPADIVGFGGFLTQKGFPFGVFLAWSVMFIQIASSAALLARRFVIPACLGHIVILGTGIWLVHAPIGWFVVGANTGGMEFSVLLIACLFSVLWAYWPANQQTVTAHE